MHCWLQSDNGSSTLLPNYCDNDSYREHEDNDSVRSLEVTELYCLLTSSLIGMLEKSMNQHACKVETDYSNGYDALLTSNTPGDS